MRSSHVPYVKSLGNIFGVKELGSGGWEGSVARRQSNNCLLHPEFSPLACMQKVYQAPVSIPGKTGCAKFLKSYMAGSISVEISEAVCILPVR